MNKIEPCKFGKRDLNEYNHWKEIDKISIDRPTVICLGGNATLTPKDANNVCKVAESLLGLKEKTRENQIATRQDVNIVGISYGKQEENSKTSSLSGKEIMKIVNETFIPLCYDKNGNILPKQDMLRNFNRITFFTHCHGAVEANNLLINTFYKMQDIGIDKVVANDVLNQVTAVSYAPFQNIFTQNLQVVSMKDDTLFAGPLRSKTTEEYLLGCMEQDYKREHGVVAYKEDKEDDTVTILVSNFRKEGNEHALGIIERDKNWQLSAKEDMIKQIVDKNTTPDDAEELTNCLNRNDDVSQAMAITLSEYVGNSIQNYYNELNGENAENFISKPNSNIILHDVKEVLGKSYNEQFENTINIVKEDIELEPNLN